MTRLKFICIFSLLLLAFGAKAQTPENNDPIVMEIQNEKIHLSEFMEQFNLDEEQINALDKNTLNEYLELYLIYKLKIREGIALGLDTANNFKEEFKEYRNKAISRYLYDKDVYENGLNKAYSRYGYAAKASHILVAVHEYADAKDTLAAYKKALGIRDRVLKKEESFKDLAIELSDDSTARPHFNMYERREIEGNGGDLGFLTVFAMPEAFEDFIFTANDGVVSSPIRTEKGYHIIYLEKRIPFYGKATLEHIWVSTSDSKTAEIFAKSKIDEAYYSLKKGEEFSDVAKKYSADQSAQSTGGRVQNVGIANMIPEYVMAISALKPNEYSEPFQTSFGWHIVRLIQKEDVPSFDEAISSLEFRMDRSGRKQPAINKFIADQKKARNFKEVSQKDLTSAFKEIENILTDSVFSGTWKMPVSAFDLKKNLFSINNRWCIQADFLNYINQKQNSFRTNQPYALSLYVRKVYNSFVNDVIIQLSENLFPREIPALGKTISAFYDGLLVYAYNEKEIWNKAILDTIGLENFYESTKNSHYSTPEYMWNTRANVTTWFISDNNCLDAEKCNKILKKALAKNIDDEDTYKTLLNSLKKSCYDKENVIEFKSALEEHSRSMNDNIWTKNSTVINHNDSGDNSYTITVTKDILSPELKKLSEAKGYYINNYQEFLEKQSNTLLKKKYVHKIYFDVFR
ncbi:peptidylprolyl isomerase [Bacteroidales bacterium OttesenSCG-928-C19]|nr:peptidylprolyl isomerase [Bacteroidales bacterium OttesenSCG-928-C19]